MTWPAPLAHLAAAHGDERTWSVGLTALGYPPTWATELDEARVVFRAMAANAKGQV